MRFRLVVLTPGSTRRDYARFRFAEASVWFGVVTWAVAVAVLGPALHRRGLDAFGIAVATALALIAGGLVHRVAAGVRRGAREAWVCLGPAPVSLGVRAADLAAAEAAQLLCTIDDLRAEDRIDAVEYELVWSRAWNLLPPRRVRERGRGPGLPLLGRR